jgi:hypothetical protein
MARVVPDNDDPAAAPILQELLALFSRPLGELGIPAAAHVHAIRSLRAAVHGFLLLEATAQFQLADDPEESFTWLVDAVIRGLG